jgi:hypothetical protein
MDNLKSIFTQDLTKLSLEKQKQVLMDAENASEAANHAASKMASQMDPMDMLKISRQSRDLNPITEKFRKETDIYKEAQDNNAGLKYAQSQLLYSPYPEIQDRAAESIDTLISDIVGGLQEKTPEFQVRDLEQLLHFASKHYETGKACDTKIKRIEMSKAHKIENFVAMLSVHGIAHEDDDLMDINEGKHGLTELTDFGELMLVRLQQLSTRELMNKIDKKSGPAREI